MLLSAADVAPSRLEEVATVAEIVGTLVTAIAIVIGAVWAYFKFIKNRTYRPRLEVTMSAERTDAAGSPLLLARVAVKNIGNSVVQLLQHGTGLRVSCFTDQQPLSPETASWLSMRVYKILREHEWIEPGETISDDVLIHAAGTVHVPVLFETRLVWSWSGGDENIVVFARQVFPVPQKLPPRDGPTDGDHLSAGGAT